jgi:aerobic-type carbon monoxide dehydrogenase small subunit (CoxS/CutS family)
MIKTLVVGGQYTDPTDWNGEIVKCELCDKQAERDDEYCENHQRCYYCGQREMCSNQGKNCFEHPEEKAIKEIDKTIKKLFCRCGRYKEDGYQLCYLCLNG